MGYWAVYYTCPQSFIIHYYKNFLILIGWINMFSVQNCQPLIVIHRRVYFVYVHWECIVQGLQNWEIVGTKLFSFEASLQDCFYSNTKSLNAKAEAAFKKF